MNRYRAILVLLLLPSTLAVAQAQDVSLKLDSAMRVAERAGFSGVVRVERAGATLLEKGYGMANRAEKISFTPATIVQIGSNTKDFTAVAILQLQQAGQLSMNDSIGKYFTNAPTSKRDITIRQLMNHCAGFPLGIGGDFEALS
ncbi:MAG: serine hydrolase domain-containing protein, partial [bacterium]